MPQTLVNPSRCVLNQPRFEKEARDFQERVRVAGERRNEGIRFLSVSLRLAQKGLSPQNRLERSEKVGVGKLWTIGIIVTGMAVSGGQQPPRKGIVGVGRKRGFELAKGGIPTRIFQQRRCSKEVEWVPGRLETTGGGPFMRQGCNS
jgi:hypothetical protein